MKKKPFHLEPPLDVLLRQLRLYAQSGQIQCWPIADGGRTIAIVHFAHVNDLPFDSSHPAFDELIELADANEVPLFMVRYADADNLDISPGNMRACGYLSGMTPMKQSKFVSLLEHCRIY